MSVEKKMKIAVTGGAGFIGSHVVDAYVEAGHDVTVIDNLSTGLKKNVNSKATFVKMDIGSSKLRELFEKEQFDIVNHHAAQANVRVSVEEPDFDATVNILGSINVFESAHKTGVKKLIMASTGGAIYGEQKYFPADERHPKRPSCPYGVAKLAAEKYLSYYRVTHGMEYVVLRYTNVYGPRQNPKGEAGVVAIFAEALRKGKQPVINGDGFQTRDYVYVGDVARANVMALESDLTGSFNCCTGVETSVNTIFTVLNVRTGSKAEEEHGPAMVGEQQRSVCSYKKLNKATGWEPEVVLDDGLTQTLASYAKK